MATRRRLPHHYPEGRTLFVTAHLHGSLPAGRFPPPDKVTSGEAFAWLDRYLDRATDGPRHLHDPAVAQAVVSTLRYAESELRYCDLHAYVLMGNHMHLLTRPLVDASQLMRSVKGYSARQANLLLGRTGQPFWQHESYDHWVRDQTEWERIKRYIERNPVRAGLVAQPEQWPWSSAAAG